MLATLLKQIALTGLVLTLAAVAAGWFNSGSDPLAWRASGAAALIVWVSGAASLVVASRPAEPSARISLLLGAMLVRMSVPLAALVLLTAMKSTMGGILPRSTAGYLVLHYLVGLAVEAPLMARRAAALSDTTSVSPPKAA